MTTLFADLEAAVRAWSVADFDRGKPSPKGDDEDPGPSPWTLVFDTETTVDLAQGLRVIAYAAFYDAELIEAGLAYDPAVISEQEQATIAAFAAARGLVVRTHERFVDDVLVAVLLRARGHVVGHNLPFDFSRIASGHWRIGSWDRAMHGGVSFSFPGTDLHVQVKRNSPRSSFMRLAAIAGSSPEARRKRKRRRR